MKLFAKIIKIANTISPGFRKRLTSLLVFLFLLHLFVLCFLLIFAKQFPVLIGLVILAYGLGLRHAVDADHIAAIDNTTRKLMQHGQRPIGVGLFFSLGHSTVVIFLSLFIALSAGFIKTQLPAFEQIGQIIGIFISSFFLLTIGAINLVTLLQIYRVWKSVSKGKKYTEEISPHLHVKGVMMKILHPLIKTVNNSWNMYIIGFLFGLGFDTATEVALLSVSAAGGATGLPWWAILLLPLAFTAGMTLIDSLDGILMLGAYGWAYITPVRKLYYNLNITFLSVIIAFFIGGVEVVQLFIVQFNLSNPIFQFISTLNFGNLGFIIIGVFLASWIISIAVYKLKGYDFL